MHARVNVTICDKLDISNRYAYGPKKLVKTERISAHTCSPKRSHHSVVVVGHVVEDDVAVCADVEYVSSRPVDADGVECDRAVAPRLSHYRISRGVSC